MNSFWKGFFSLFDWNTGLPRSDQELEKLYGKMNCDKYHHPFDYQKPPSFVAKSQNEWMNNSWNASADLNRVLTAQQTFMDEIYGYNSTQIIREEFYNTTVPKKILRDAARPRRNKYL